MALITVMTPSQESVFLGDFYTYVRAERPLYVQRPLALFPRLRALRQAIRTGQVAVGVTLTEEESKTVAPDADLFAEV